MLTIKRSWNLTCNKLNTWQLQIPAKTCWHLPNLKMKTVHFRLWVNFLFWNDEDFTVIASHMLANCITKLLLFHCFCCCCFFFWSMEIEAEMLFQFLNVEIVNGLDHFREEQMVWIYLVPTEGCPWQLLRWKANKWSLKWRNSLSLNL